MRTSGRFLVVGFVIAALLVGFFGLGSASAQTLIVAQGAGAVNLDRIRPTTSRHRVRRQIYETLIVMGEDLNLYPGLATSWEQLDELTYEFKLREGVKFHNGETFKASDVKFVRAAAGSSHGRRRGVLAGGHR